MHPASILAVTLGVILLIVLLSLLVPQNVAAPQSAIKTKGKAKATNRVPARNLAAKAEPAKPKRQVSTFKSGQKFASAARMQKDSADSDFDSCDIIVSTSDSDYGSAYVNDSTHIEEDSAPDSGACESCVKVDSIKITDDKISYSAGLDSGSSSDSELALKFCKPSPCPPKDLPKHDSSDSAAQKHHDSTQLVSVSKSLKKANILSKGMPFVVPNLTICTSNNVTDKIKIGKVSLLSTGDSVVSDSAVADPNHAGVDSAVALDETDSADSAVSDAVKSEADSAVQADSVTAHAETDSDAPIDEGIAADSLMEDSIPQFVLDSDGLVKFVAPLDSKHTELHEVHDSVQPSLPTWLPDSEDSSFRLSEFK